MINSAPVVLFSKEGCKYCAMLVIDLKEMGIPYIEIKTDNNMDLGAALKSHTCHPTYPQLFIGGQFIGGYDQFQRICATNAVHDLLEKQGVHIDYTF